MSLKESLAKFFHLEKRSPYIEAHTVLNQFYKNPEIVYYDFSNTKIEYTGSYEDLIRDIQQRRKYVRMDFGEGHMDIGVLFSDPTGVTSKLDREEFTGVIKRYGVTFNEGVYVSDGEHLDPNIFIDNYGFEECDYIDYMSLLKKSISI